MLHDYPEGMAIWVPKVDSFLARVGLPNHPVNPEYLPSPVPPPTHYAAVDDVDAVPYLILSCIQNIINDPTEAG